MKGHHVNDVDKKYNFPNSRTIYYRCCNPMKIKNHNTSKIVKKNYCKNQRYLSTPNSCRIDLL